MQLCHQVIHYCIYFWRIDKARCMYYFQLNLVKKPWKFISFSDLTFSQNKSSSSNVKEGIACWVAHDAFYWWFAAKICFEVIFHLIDARDSSKYRRSNSTVGIREMSNADDRRYTFPRDLYNYHLLFCPTYKGSFIIYQREIFFLVTDPTNKKSKQFFTQLQISIQK